MQKHNGIAKTLPCRNKAALSYLHIWIAEAEEIYLSAHVDWSSRNLIKRIFKWTFFYSNQMYCKSKDSVEFLSLGHQILILCPYQAFYFGFGQFDSILSNLAIKIRDIFIFHNCPKPFHNTPKLSDFAYLTASLLLLVSSLGIILPPACSDPPNSNHQITQNYWLLISFIKITMIKRLLFLLLLPLALSQIVNTSQTVPQLQIQPCLRYAQGNCVNCPYKYHVNDNLCYLNITNCLSYSLNNLRTEVCDRCDSSASVSDGKGGCSAIAAQLTSARVAGASLDSIAQQYGDSRFQIIALSSAFSDPYFNICNNFMLKGEYGHFISRVAQAVYAVSYFAVGNENQYKILYFGSGGGLMMSIITYTVAADKPIKLNAFVPIGTTNIIDNCVLYTDSLKCSACIPGYHLQNNFCYSDIAGCNSYSRNICLQCSGYALLVENRCLGCSQMGDLAKVAFFGGLYGLVSGSSLPSFSQSYLLAA